MNRSSLFVPVIVAAALSTALLVPFACSGLATGPSFGAGASDDDDVGPQTETNTPECDGDACLSPDGGVDNCAPLLERTCDGCSRSAACQAATLLARYEPDRCTAALSDELTFPTCTAQPCEGLMERVCGGTTPTEACINNPACEPAQVLYTRATSPSSTTTEIEQAQASCATALTDEAVFAPCDG